ncbi:MAG: YebB family permuted papain-like enzyme [Candidatus Accumulibacter sp.]|jgi:hypothetical protein|nr:YebB family permuted papain-like enzyme [Accumulibacter sp.]
MKKTSFFRKLRALASGFILSCGLFCNLPVFASEVNMILTQWSGFHVTVDDTKHETVSRLGKKMRVGDVVFIQNRIYPFQRVGVATRSWTNHVGVVVDVSGEEPIVAESTFPTARRTTLSRFVGKSKAGRVAISRLDKVLSEEEQRKIVDASQKRLGIFYDTGFDLNSENEFCSRFVREILAESTGTAVGEVETFAELLSRNPEAGLGFWRLWFFGRIPWNRQTVTPASLLRDPRFHTVFDGYAHIEKS